MPGTGLARGRLARLSDTSVAVFRPTWRGWIVQLEVATKELDNRQAVLTAKVDDEWLDPYLRSASKSLAARMSIPGFRKGKAPHRVVERHMGREALVREVIEDLGQAAYDEAVAESGLEPIQLDDLEIAEWEPLTLRLTVSLPPVVELGDYRSIPLEGEEPSVGDEDVADGVEALREQYAERVPVDRALQMSDFGIVDIEGTIGEREVLNLEQQEYELQENGDTPVAGFAEKLVGMSAGEERSFTITLPDDYEDEELAGSEVAFVVRLHDVQEKHLPELDDELAKMAAGMESLEELRDDIRQRLLVRRQAEHQDEQAEKLLDSLVEQSEIDAPPVFVNREVEALVRGLAYELQEQGFTLEGYLNTTGRTAEELISEFQPTAEKRVKKALILAKLVEEEEIEVEDSEIEDEVTRVTHSYGQDRQVLRDALLGDEQVKEDIRDKLYGRKVVQRLAESGSTDSSVAEPSADSSGEEAPADPDPGD
jgi:trigger factor